MTGTLIGRLGLEGLIDETVTRGHRPGRKTLTVVSTLLAGGDCIDDVGLLHAGSTSQIVGHDTLAASTVGTWLRALTFGHIRQLDKVTETALARAWQAGAGPGDGPMFIDIDSTICEVMAMRSRARRTATPVSSACIRCSRPGPVLARSSTPDA